MHTLLETLKKTADEAIKVTFDKRKTQAFISWEIVSIYLNTDDVHKVATISESIKVQQMAVVKSMNGWCVE